MSKIEALIKQRGTLLERITQIANYATTLNENNTPEEAKVRIKSANKISADFASVESEIFKKVPETESIAIAFDNQYYAAIARLNEWLRKNHPEPIANISIQNESLNQTFQQHCDVKLPRLNLPTFTGDYQEWQSFYDMFNSTVHENSSLSAIQKFQYLKGALKDEASALIKHLPVTELNYMEAYQKLHKRFSKKRLIMSSYIQTFLDQKPATDISAKDIRHICDTSDEIIRGIKALGTNAESRDPWLIHIVLSKLDEETQQYWSNETCDNEFPSWQRFIDYLNKRADALENCQATLKKLHTATTIKSHNITIIECPLCPTNHRLFECPKFKEMDLKARADFMQSSNRCYNCLSDTHTVYNCRSRWSCSKCRKRHNTLLHKPFTPSTISTNVTDADLTLQSSDNLNATTSSHAATQTIPSLSSTFSKGLLQTAIVQIRGVNSEMHTCRALLDSGSLASFITSACIQRLGLARKHSRVLIEGIGSTKAGTAKGEVHIQIQSCKTPFTSFNIDALILEKITSIQPQSSISPHQFDEFSHLDLADPSFHEPSEIDLLIGCDLYLSLLLPNQIISKQSNLRAQETILGWVISGKTNDIAASEHVTSICTAVDVDETLKRFWEIEEIKQAAPPSPQDIYCEEFFMKTTTRHTNGKYIVQLPFLQDAKPLGQSKSQAISRLFAMERRFAREPHLKKDYVNFMREFEELGHMEKIPINAINKPHYRVFYLPHHPVFKDDSTTTKMRVVFDASAKTSTGRSLNNNLLIGPELQQSLQQILLRFRFYPYVMSGDLEKMFRQILVTESHTDFQRIVWREDPSDQIKEYRILTVTYGTACASFLAKRVLQQISKDNQNQFPAAAAIISRDFYVDDLMTGANSVDELILLKNEIQTIMKNSGFNLRKWKSNVNDILQEENSNQQPMELKDQQTCAKVLGVYWDSAADLFTYRIQLDSEPDFTKRGMLSEASKLFDPQGWLAPAIIYVKILFQKTWMQQLEWTDQLNAEVKLEWQKFREESKLIENIKIPRSLKLGDTPFQLHGFADASKNAYAAVVYAKCFSKTDGPHITIIAAKTKVAPVKQISIARLELCAALLLTQLMDFVRELLGNREYKTFLWTDSTIVLAWISTVPRNLEVFEGNRVSQISTHYPRKIWHYITSAQNPADCASRGLLPSELVNHKLWWTGPNWLIFPPNQWPTKYETEETTINCNLDENGIIRVGGRIAQSTVPYDVKHPIILPNDDLMAETIVRTIHLQYLHASHNLLTTIIRQSYWILRCKSLVKFVIHKCIPCFRQKQATNIPMMAELPPSRVTLVRPFLSTGVDYAGPLYVRPSRRRGLKPDKAYIVVFICLSTKAVHVELAGDMSTETFIAALRRFISRRGLCHDIFSDNGSNFIGAKREINELFTIIKNNSISSFLSQNQINWHFNPPSAPHFGGIWEAAVKSIKYHLKRTLGNAKLTYEEMNTVLVQIESILNSRPLCTTSDDDLNPLTPSHFLIGHPHTNLPDPDLAHLKLSHLARWQYIQKLRQDFWKKWHRTYLISLQKRTKWTDNKSNIKLDDIVLLHEENLPPSNWKLGRVIALHPGNDNIVRVVTIRTDTGTLKRPVIKLSVLPLDDKK